MTTPEELWQRLESLSDSLLDSLEDKCTELGFDPAAGITTIREAVTNAKHSRDLLRAAVREKKLIQLPISIQNRLTEQLDWISKYATAIQSGNNEVLNFVQAVDSLLSLAWQYNLHNLSGEVVGYLEKLNQLKLLEGETIELRRELLTALKAKKRLEELEEHARLVDAANTENLTKLTSRTTEAGEIVKQTTEFSQKASAVLATAQQTDTTLAQLQASAKSREAEITAVQTRILDFSKKIEGFTQEISTTSSIAQTTIADNRTRTDSLITELERLEGQIKEAIERATGYSLFNSFAVRQSKIAEQKNQWRWILLGLVVLSVGATLLIGFTTKEFDVAFYIKLAISIPLAYSIGFCTLQYSRERKLEEEYAFKGNISISLVSYKDLVEKMIDPKNAEERLRYTTFLIDAIREVYTPPIGTILDGDSHGAADPEKALKRLSKTVELIVKPLEPLINAIRK